MITQESLFIEQVDHKIHLRVVKPQAATDKAPVLLVHGAIEDGRIFYSKSDKGLACELARAGYPTYVVDLRGRGLSEPSIKNQPNHGQLEAITETLPNVHAFIFTQHKQAVHWMAHSWGGVLLASVLSRHQELAAQVASQVYFGTKRSVHSWSMERLLKIELFWHLIGPAIARVKGYLPAKELGLGADNETKLSLREGRTWVKKRPWTDPRDGFDYFANAKGLIWPKTWLIAAIDDHALGNPIDVQHFADEMGVDKVSILSKANGNLVDYDHINMLVHPKAKDDHFLEVIEFINN